jgi:hypothetical protein
MWHAPQGLHDFLRAYYHVKSADWSANQPMPLKAWQAEVLAALPHYYVMPYPSTMACLTNSNLHVANRLGSGRLCG